MSILTPLFTGAGGGGGMSDLVDDLTPQLGGPLDVNSQEIQSAADITLQLGDAAGANKLSIQDSGSVEVFNVDSNGYIDAAGIDFSANGYIDGGDGPRIRGAGSSYIRFFQSDGNVDIFGSQTGGINTDITFKYLTPAADWVPGNLILEAQSALASATINQDAGHIKLKMGEHATGGGSAGQVQFVAPDDSIVYSIDETGVIDAQTGGDVTFKLGDAAGANKLSVQDSAGVEEARITSNGNVQVGLSGTYLPAAFAIGSDQRVSLGLTSGFALLTGIGGVSIGDSPNSSTQGLKVTDNFAGAHTAHAGDFTFGGQTRGADSAPVNIILAGQSAYASAATNLVGGAVNLDGGTGASGSAGLASGGDITITGGTGYGTGDGGDILLTGGTASGSGAQGLITIDGTLNTAADMTVKLGDAAGTNKLSVLDSDSAEVASINSDGKVVAVDLGLGSLNLDNASSALRVTGGVGGQLLLGGAAVGGTSLTFASSGLFWPRHGIAPIIRVAQQNSDIATVDLTIEGHTAQASAVTNQDAGHIKLKMGEHATGGGSAGQVQFIAPDDSVLYGIDETGVIDAQTGGDMTVKLGDAAGTNKFSIQDSGGTERVRFDSEGGLTITSAKTAGQTVATFGTGNISVNDGNNIFCSATNNGQIGLYGGGITASPAFIKVYGRTAGSGNAGAIIIDGNTRNSDSDCSNGVSITGPAAYASATTNLVGGPISLTGGAGASGSAGAANGGDVTITAGTGYGTGAGGNITLAGGTPGSGAQGIVDVSAGTEVHLDQTTADAPFFNFQATADADTTSAISTNTTSGSTTHHIQVEINGTKAWIAVSTNAPS
jgi:filamentous hemagglutinin